MHPIPPPSYRDRPFLIMRSENLDVSAVVDQASIAWPILGWTLAIWMNKSAAAVQNWSLGRVNIESYWIPPIWIPPITHNNGVHPARRILEQGGHEQTGREGP
jgi:hypothetical protein